MTTAIIDGKSGAAIGDMDDLQELEQVIHAGYSAIEDKLQVFVDIGEALLQIRERNLYLLTGWSTFDDYCKGMWPKLANSTRYYKLQAAEAKAVIPDDIKTAHASVLRRYLRDGKELDAELVKKTWQEVTATVDSPDTITTNYVEAIAKKQWLIKNSGPLGEAVRLQQITPDKAYALQKTLERLPEAYTIAVIKFGIGQTDCVSGDTLNRIQSLSYQDKDAANSILTSGFLRDVPLWRLTPQDIERYQRWLNYEKTAANILTAIDNQKSQVVGQGNNARIFDSVGAWQLEDAPLLYFIFANGSTDDTITFIKNNKLNIFFVAAYDPENPPDINFDGTAVKPQDIQVKPKPTNLIQYIKNSTK